MIPFLISLLVLLLYAAIIVMVFGGPAPAPDLVSPVDVHPHAHPDPMATTVKHLALLLVLACAGCVHKAAVIDAPDSAALQLRGRQLAEAVNRSKAAVKTASDAVKAAQASHNAEEAKAKAIGPKVDYLFSVAPQELKPLVAEIQMEVGELHEAQMLTDTQMNAALSAQSVATARLEEATAAKNEVAKLSEAYFSDVEKLTLKANNAETGWAKDSKALAWYRLHWFLGIAVAVGGVLLCLLFAFLKFTGRLALTASKF